MNMSFSEVSDYSYPIYWAHKGPINKSCQGKFASGGQLQFLLFLPGFNFPEEV